MEKLKLFPLTTLINKSGHLDIGGCDCLELIKEFGSPLYIFDEAMLRTQCRSFSDEFTRRYKDSLVVYASKAFSNKAVINIIKEEGLGLDIVSGGELAVAKSVSFPQDKIFFHGNNKTRDELQYGLEYRVGYVVVDNFHELELLNKLALNNNIKQKIMLRLSPGIDAHTHKKTTTGILDSKFGFAMETGQAEDAVKQAMSSSNLELIGLHCHLGSPIYDTSPYKLGIDIIIAFAAKMRQEYGFQLKYFSPGGGFAVQYTTDKPAPAPAEYAEDITAALIEASTRYGISQPWLTIEPGRAIIARAGVTLYTVGSRKEIPNIRTYVFVDGGMGDNIRPSFYQSEYEAILADNPGAREDSINTIAGKYCESGDILIKDAHTAPLAQGNVVAIPATGAYAPAMASNYNMIPRPAIVMVNNGKARIIRKRESYEDLIRLDNI
jgi:diaminopimelate decarboxylase